MTSPQPAEERLSARRRIDTPPRIEIELPDRTLHLVSAWGLFSAKSIDEGTALLLRQLVVLPPQARLLDLGCGYGVLGLALAGLWPDADVVLSDKDVLAVETTAANITRNSLTNARAVLSPGFRDVPAGPYDLIVSNLPAQVGNEAIDALLIDAHDHLAVDGTIVVVTVLGLKRFIKRRLQELFGNYHKAKQGARHIVAEATRLPATDDAPTPLPPSTPATE